MRQQLNQRKREKQQLAVAGVNIYPIWFLTKKNILRFEKLVCIIFLLYTESTCIRSRHTG